MDEFSLIFNLDAHGHLYADSNGANTSNANNAIDYQFEIRKKGNKIAFKSLKYQHKLLSKALLKNVFHFHRLQVSDKNL